MGGENKVRTSTPLLTELQLQQERRREALQSGRIRIAAAQGEAPVHARRADTPAQRHMQAMQSSGPHHVSGKGH